MNDVLDDIRTVDAHINDCPVQEAIGAWNRLKPILVWFSTKFVPADSVSFVTDEPVFNLTLSKDINRGSDQC